MKKSRFTESQIVQILKEGEAGLTAAELVRKHGISAATHSSWKSKYAGVAVSELKRLRELETKNAKLKRIGRAGAGERGDQGRSEPTIVEPSAKRQVAEVPAQDHRLPVRRACQIVKLSRAAYTASLDAQQSAMRR